MTKEQQDLQKQIDLWHLYYASDKVKDVYKERSEYRL